MCGIFGLIRNPGAQCPLLASEAFVLLGELSVERGRDSAGFALSGCHGTEATQPARKMHSADQAFLDQVYVAKGCVPFTDLWDESVHAPLLNDSVVALGHTRWATQGAKDALVNASPLLAGRLVGTHNGDLDMSSLPPSARKRCAGTTDTEALFHALDDVARDRRAVKDVLARVVGRAALAWMDRGRQDRVFLARGGLSPLAVAYDAEGNFWWASNPRWFRDIDEALDGAVGFRDIRLVREGTLLTVTAGKGSPTVADERTFVPTVRQSDERIASIAAWRWFDDEDEKADKAQANHKVAAPSWASTQHGQQRGQGKSTKAGKPVSQRPERPANDMYAPAPRPGGNGALDARIGAEEPDPAMLIDALYDGGSGFDDPFYVDGDPDLDDAAFRAAVLDDIDDQDWEAEMDRLARSS